MNQEILPGFEPSEEDLYQKAISESLESKTQKALNLIRTFCGDTMVAVAFSGGKDSIVIKELCKMAGITFSAIYSVTTIDPPELIHYIKKFHPDVIWNRPKMHMLKRLAEKKGPPTRLMRWCCEEYKERAGDGYEINIIGVRAEESQRRKGLWRLINKNRRTGTLIIAPIVYWTDKNIWDFIRLNHLPYCSLYDEGFSRLGCIGCPLAGPVAQRKEFDRWPRYEKLWKQAVFRHWYNWHGVPRQDGKSVTLTILKARMFIGNGGLVVRRELMTIHT